MDFIFVYSVQPTSVYYAIHYCTGRKYILQCGINVLHISGLRSFTRAVRSN